MTAIDIAVEGLAAALASGNIFAILAALFYLFAVLWAS